MTPPRVRTVLVLMASLLVVLATVPSSADTKSELAAARAQLDSLQADLNRLSASYSDALSSLARTQQRLEEVAAQVHRLRGRMAEIRQRLAVRARAAYEGSGADIIEVLLSAGSFSDFSDRAEFLGQVVQGDGDLLVQAKVTGEELRRAQQDLEQLSADQAAEVSSLSRQRTEIDSKFAEMQSIESSLQKKLQREQAAAAAARTLSAPVHSSGALQSCPTGQPRAFTDSFGAPRPGGRTHQGIDLLAPLGTPVYAAQSGRFEQNYNSLGGTSALLYAGNGDYTYYAHMSSYAGVANGATVGAGTVIGHVGNTGDAQGGPFHVHFEYHPGGGAAVDPYNLLRAVCG